ncbi:PspA/IM30 family protein [Vibrio sp. WXL103]|uniref:PspA/IM30 family protein n=1 Tax=unclassified Vibrio TaxID=2614977 RepID=UPI003EC593A4
MSAFKRLWTGIKGIVNNEVEAIADKNAIPELQQATREAKAEIQTLDQNIAKTRGERKLADNEIAELQAKIAGYEENVREFAAQENMEMATKIAAEIANQRPKLEAAVARRDTILANENKMIAIVQNLKEQITGMEQEIAQIESTEKLQRAQAATLNVTAGLESKSKTALEALERTKKRQKSRAAELEAATELAAEAEAPKGIDAEIAAAKAGKSDAAQSELERILAGKE